MKIEALEMPGCYLINPKVFQDNRGEFVKIFQSSKLINLGLDANFQEEFITTSAKGVIRGLHFQCPPADQAKLVYCIKGGVLDVFVDLRAGSPTFKEHLMVELNGVNNYILYLPTGIAHGFCSLKDESIMVYKTTTEYAPEFDEGIRWDSCNINWPISSPVISGRDLAFGTLKEFRTPFAFNYES